MFRIFLLNFIITLVLLCNVAIAKEFRSALVIGNGQYRVGSLKNAEADANDMASSLRQLGFSVDIKTNLDLRGMLAALEAFRTKLQKSDVGLFYYAGHGIQVDGENYLIPIGADINLKDQVKYEAVNAAVVLSNMEASRSSINIVILDACRNNPFLSTRSVSRGLAVMSSGKGAFLAYSTSPGSVASDGTGRNSLFTKYLLQKLATPGQDIEYVFKKVRKEVVRESGGAQIPWVSSSLTQDFVFSKAASGGTATRPVEPNRASNSLLPQNPRIGDTWREPITGMEFKWVPKGCFQMGSSDPKLRATPVHGVCLDGFWLGKYEVTLDEYRTFLLETNNISGVRWGSSPAPGLNKERPYSLRGNLFGMEKKQPMTGVTWFGAKAFTQWLGQRHNLDFRLPTEAEWEYAATGGGGPELYSGSNDLDTVAWYHRNCDHTRRVGEKAPNRFGIYDMTGNLEEWCEDNYDSDAYKKHYKSNPNHQNGNKRRVCRGGDWQGRDYYLNTRYRGYENATYGSFWHGIRVVIIP